MVYWITYLRIKKNVFRELDEIIEERVRLIRELED